MSRSTAPRQGFRAGDWVRVRSADEILATLDEHGRLDGLPFMPEMLPFCGRRFRVYKSAHKTCDTVQSYMSRRMSGAVHLEGLRCDGEAHGGCKAGCLLFWKEAWLEPATAPASAHRPETEASVRPEAGGRPETVPAAAAVAEMLARNTIAPSAEGGAEVRYSCQATDLVRATTLLHPWDPRQYVKDLTSRNVTFGEFVRYALLAAFNLVMHLNWRGRPYPYVCGLAGDKTQAETLDLQPGDLVQIRPKDEVMATLSAGQRNRGLWFDVEMVPFCGRTFRVLRRVEKIINEKTGAMIHLPGVCLVLEGVTCSGHHSRGRLFCPRSIYPFWHEIWLKRVEPAAAGHDATPLVKTAASSRDAGDARRA